MAPMTIYHVGASLRTQGGISSVLTLYMTNYRDLFRERHISSYLGQARFFDYLYFSKAIIQVVLVCLIDKNPVFHIHTASQGSFLRKSILAWLIRMFGKPYIAHIHGAMFDKFMERASPRKRAAIMTYLERAVKIVVLSASWKAYFEQFVPADHIVVIYNPCRVYPLDERKRGSPGVRFLFLGRIGERKGAYDLIKAAALLPDLEFHLDIYGDGEVDKLRKCWAELPGRHAKVEIHGWVRHDRVGDIYNQADILMLPSYHEGLPMSILEAMGRGLAIISTRVGGIPEAVIDRENGFLVPPGDVEALAEKMLTLITQPTLLQKMGECSHELARQKFSVETIGGQLSELYKTLQ
jgi:glycosyltransferase involved in cell wall biosynthesis